MNARTKHYPPTSDAVIATHQEVRTRFGDLIDWLETLPSSREVSLAITEVQAGSMWANAAVARHQLETFPPDPSWP